MASDWRNVSSNVRKEAWQRHVLDILEQSVVAAEKRRRCTLDAVAVSARIGVGLAFGRYSLVLLVDG